MREMFVLDKKNYNPNGSVGRRPSVRGIIIRDGKIAMMHSRKYNYYKLPGGGIEPEETLEDTLIREVREENGLIVKPETIKEFVSVTDAICVNESANHFEKENIATFRGMLDRENIVLDLLLAEM